MSCQFLSLANILEVNKQKCAHKLRMVSLIFRAQDLLRSALKTETIRLRVHSSSHRRPPAASPADGIDALKDGAKNDAETSGRAVEENQAPEEEAPKSKAPVAPPARNPGTTLTTKAKYPSTFNTRMIGQKIKISLKKGRRKYITGAICAFEKNLYNVSYIFRRIF